MKETLGVQYKKTQLSSVTKYCGSFLSHYVRRHIVPDVNRNDGETKVWNLFSEIPVFGALNSLL